jgi:hypothetical protein
MIMDRDNIQEFHKMEIGIPLYGKFIRTSCRYVSMPPWLSHEQRSTALSSLPWMPVIPKKRFALFLQC